MAKRKRKAKSKSWSAATTRAYKREKRALINKFKRKHG